MTLTGIFKECNTKDLKRVLRSNKAYLKIKISVFNVGTVVKLSCTDTFKEINYNTWNGYDSIHEIDSLIITLIESELKSR